MPLGWCVTFLYPTCYFSSVGCLCYLIHTSGCTVEWITPLSRVETVWIPTLKKDLFVLPFFSLFTNRLSKHFYHKSSVCIWKKVSKKKKPHQTFIYIYKKLDFGMGFGGGGHGLNLSAGINIRLQLQWHIHLWVYIVQ